MVESKHSRETDADQQGSAGIDGLMAGLPPLLLGTYTPKGTRQAGASCGAANAA